MRAKELVAKFEKFAPRYLAEPGDPVGWQLGDPNQEVSRVLVTLDVRPEVVAEAIQSGAEMIFAHHPAMFRKIQNLDYRDPQKAMYGELAAHHIVVYAAHTNLDSANGGMNDWLAAALKLTDTTALVPGYRETFMAVSAAIDVPAEVLTAFDAVALPEPHQFKVPERLATRFTAKLHDLHPQVNMTMVALPSATIQYGMGRVGNLSTPVTVRQFAENCKAAFSVPGLRLVSATPDKLIRRVAVLGGDGGKFYHQALAAGADVYVTGDVYYHTGHDMLAAGLSVVDPGHHIESICKPHLTALFRSWADDADWSVKIQASQLNTDPFTFI